MSKFSDFLKGDTVESTIRIATVMIIVSGAIVCIAIAFAIVWYAVHQIPIPGTEMGAALGGDAAYTGAGVAGKVWQKKYEVKDPTRKYSTPKTEEFQG